MPTLGGLIARLTKTAAISSIAAALFRQPKLLLCGVAHFFPRFAHVFAGFLECIEFLLLIRRQDRANLRACVVPDCLDFLPGILADRHDLRLSLIEDRLDLCLLVRREIEGFG